MTSPLSCPVCDLELAAPNVANCHNCRRDFHLQMRMDVAGIDCGQVWLHEEHTYLMFGCNQCLEAGHFEGMAPTAEGRG
jgi:hypothetical protein